MSFSEIVPIESSPIPHPRSGHRAVATDSDLWIFGGYHPTADNDQPCMFNELWRFNYALRQWTLETTTGDRPRETLASCAMCLVGHCAFVFGGTGFPFGVTISNALHILDLKRLSWRRYEFSEGDLQEVYGASIIQKDEYLYILCGTNRTAYSMRVYQIHLPRRTCTLIGDTTNQMDWFNDGRYRQEVHLHDQQIFVFGGGGMFATTFALDKVPVFDIPTRQWSYVDTNPDPMHNYPQPRKFHSIIPSRDNEILMFGGAYFDVQTHDHVPVDEHVWSFNFTTLQWSLVSSLNLIRPVYFQAAALNQNGELWTHGGVIGETDADTYPMRISNIYHLSIRVKKLSEIVWKTFLSHLPDRRCLINDPKLLTELNIPLQFARRIH